MTIWIVFVLAGLGTYGLRLSGIALLRDPDRISPTLQRGLRMIGPAAMGAIIANSLVLSDGEWRPFGAWHVAAFVALAAGFWKRSMGWAMAAGVATFAALLATGVA